MLTPSFNGNMGKFKEGNKFGKGGNPQAKQAKQYKAACLNATSEKEAAAIFKKIVSLAINGDISAAKVVLPYLLGNPDQKLELSGPDGEAIRVEGTPRLSPMDVQQWIKLFNSQD